MGCDSGMRAFSVELFVRFFFAPPKGQNPMLLKLQALAWNRIRLKEGRRCPAGGCGWQMVQRIDGSKHEHWRNEWIERQANRPVMTGLFRYENSKRGEYCWNACVRCRVVSKRGTMYVRDDRRVWWSGRQPIQRRVGAERMDESVV